ncbi:MAG: nucleotidyl transferase AbiEii/AbiGii toxin family protein [Acidobacteriota bacterium]
MDFVAGLDLISGFLAGRAGRSAVIGGIALAAYGNPRTTIDLDFVVDGGLQDELIAFLEGEGFKTLFCSSGYSNHDHPDPERGRLDFVYVRGTTAEKIFAECRRLSGPGGSTILVPKPEHLAALKAQATKNEPSRAPSDLADVRFLLGLPGVDHQTIREYFERAGQGDLFDALERSF